jgi:hypothetical protein
LRSGRPIVRQRLLTHTQVLGDEIAILTGATPWICRRDSSGDRDPDRAGAIGARAAELAATKYSYAAYLARTREAVGRLAPGAAAAVQRSTV